MRGAFVWLVLVVVGAVGLGGCGFSVYDLPLPGGTDVGSNPITVQVQFHDVLDLVPDSTVKVDDVSVGNVKSIGLSHGIAVVTVQLRRDTKLPANATASIEQTSLLGEKFVNLQTPPDPSSQLLADGATIPLSRTGTNPQIEDVLGALSLVLNGGGVAQLKTIATELNKALGGHEDAARSVITQVDTLMRNLDDNKQSIVDAITSLNRLSANVEHQERTIDATLDELPAAVRSINGQRRDLVTMLRALSKLGKTGTRVILASKTNTIAIIRDLQPTLTELAATGNHFVNSFNTLLSYPFVDASVGTTPEVARNLRMGDYVNLDITLNLDFSTLLGSKSHPPTLLPPTVAPTKIVSEVLQCIQSGSLTSKACEDVLGSAKALANLKNECQKPANQNTTVCQLLNTVPGLPSLDPSQLGSVLPSLGLGGLAGDERAPASLSAGGGVRRVSVRQLDGYFDPGLVSLMVPGLDAERSAQ